MDDRFHFITWHVDNLQQHRIFFMFSSQLFLAKKKQQHQNNNYRILAKCIRSLEFKTSSACYASVISNRYKRFHDRRHWRWVFKVSVIDKSLVTLVVNASAFNCYSALSDACTQSFIEFNKSEWVSSLSSVCYINNKSLRAGRTRQPQLALPYCNHTMELLSGQFPVVPIIL